MSDQKKFDFRSKEFTADIIVHNCMTEFSIDLAEQTVASVVDGLKFGYRRILHAIRNTDGRISLNMFVGRVIEKHPVGNNSIGDACIRGMQEFSMGIPLLIGKGNFGDYASNDAGADRYLKVGIHPFARDLYFEGVSFDTLPMKETEDFMDIEPVYLIPRLPTTLLVYSLTLGSGFKAETFPIAVDDVCTVVQKYVEHLDKNPYEKMDYSKIAHHFIPDFPIKNAIRNSSHLVESFKRGDYTPQITTEGYFSISQNQIILHTAPFGSPFATVDEKLRTILSDKKSWLYEICTEFRNLKEGIEMGALALTFKRGVDTFEVAYRLSKELGITRGLRSIPKFVTRHGSLVTMTPPDLLELWFKLRKRSVLSGIKNAQISNIKQTLELETLLMVCDSWDDVIGIIRNPLYKGDAIIHALMDRFDLSYAQASTLADSRLKNANTNTRQEIQERIDDLKIKAITLKESLGNANEIIYKDAEYFKKKYGKPRRSKISHYLGYICVADKHLHQFDSVTECKELLNKFQDAKVEFYTDTDKFVTTHIVTNGSPSNIGMTLPPRVCPGKKVLCSPKFGKAYTICITEDTASIADGVISYPSGSTVVVGEKFVGILSDGTVEQMTTKSLTKKRGEGKRGARSDLAYAIPYQFGDGVLVHMNKVDPGTVVFSRITQDTTKVPMSLMDKTEFLGFIPFKMKTPVVLNLPEWANNFKYITIDDIEKVIKDSSTVNIAIGRKATKDYDLRTSVQL